MIIAIIISIVTFLIVLLFWGTWGLSSEEIDGKLDKASFGKTIILFFLTLAVSVFYVKTYNVATIKNIVKVKGINCSIDSNKNIVDTLEYLILRCSFTKDHNKHNKITKITGEKYFDEYYDVNSMGGGFEGLIRYNTDRDAPVRTFGKYSDYDIDENNYIYSNHVYHFEFMGNKIPTINPFEIRYEQHDYGFINYNQGDYAFFRLFTSFVNDSTIRKAPNVGIREYLGDNSIRIFGELGTAYLDKFINEEINKNPQAKLEGLINCEWFEYLNNLNLFSAADLTQCNYDIIYDFDCPLKQLYLQFDMPAIISQLPYNLEPKDSYSYFIKDFDNSKKSGSLLLHIQFPTLANMQLVRSLVLTSILTAFFSLFCLNMYYLVRKHNKCIPYILKNKRIYTLMITVILLIIIILTLLLATDSIIYLNRAVPANYNING